LPRLAVICNSETDAEVNRVIALAQSHGLDVVIGRDVELERARISWSSAWAKLNEMSESASTNSSKSRIAWADQGTPVLEALASVPNQDLRETVLGPLADSDTETQLLRETLHSYLAHNGQAGPAANALGVHRNTLRHRLDRIEQLTNRSLASADDRAELWIALRLLEQ
jgi:purine catabolism regulator